VRRLCDWWSLLIRSSAMATNRYANQKSYFPPGSSSMSPGLLRARRPFFTRNLLTGALVASFAVGVYLYSISAVKQDDFSKEDIQGLIAETQRSQAVVDLETSILGGGPLGSRREPSVAVPAPPASAPSGLGFDSTWRSSIGFRGRAGPSIIVKDAPNIDRLGRMGDAR
jgi:cytochrome c oxidase assembly factor 3